MRQVGMISLVLELYLVARDSEKECPFLKIQRNSLKDGRKDIRIFFLGTRHHYSFHEAKIFERTTDGIKIDLHGQVACFKKRDIGGSPVVFTSYDEDKEPNTWDNEIRSAAEKSGLKPERHVKYYENKVLRLDTLRYGVGGRLVALKEKKRYSPDKCFYLELKEQKICVETFFSFDTFDQKLDLVIDSQIGKVGFLFKTI